MKWKMLNIERIDKMLEPEVNEYKKACELSFEKYGNIYHAEEFLSINTDDIIRK